MDKKTKVKIAVFFSVAIAFISTAFVRTRYLLPHALPSEAVKNLGGQVAVDTGGDLSGYIYNGTRWEVVGVVIRLTLYTQASTPKGWQIESSSCSDAPTEIPVDGKSFLVRDYALDIRI